MVVLRICVLLGSELNSTLGCSIIEDRFLPGPPHPELKWNDCASVLEGSRIAQRSNNATIATRTFCKELVYMLDENCYVSLL